MGSSLTQPACLDRETTQKVIVRTSGRCITHVVDRKYLGLEGKNGGWPLYPQQSLDKSLWRKSEITIPYDLYLLCLQNIRLLFFVLLNSACVETAHSWLKPVHQCVLWSVCAPAITDKSYGSSLWLGSITLIN